jgi:hypothetical protein
MNIALRARARRAFPRGQFMFRPICLILMFGLSCGPSWADGDLKAGAQ